jgi:hypothetical protein
MSLTSWTGNASHTEDPNPCMTLATINPLYDETWEHASKPAQYCVVGNSQLT